MFIIVPKHGRHAGVRVPQDSEETMRQSTMAAAATTTPTTSHPAAEDDRGPVRTAKACESCRIKKTKCNGQQPCALCRRRNIVCVFPRTAARDLPISGAKATLLRHQQRRLYTAVQQMASVIAKLESDIETDPSSIDVLEQLNKYAPASEDEDEDSNLLPEEDPRPAKRRREDPNVLPTSTAEFSTDLQPLSEEQAFQDQFTMNTAKQSSNETAYESVMQFLRSMSNGSGPRGAATLEPANPPNLLAPMPYGSLTDINGTGQYTAGLGSSDSAPLIQQDGLPSELTNLIDWEASLANFQTAQDLFGYDTVDFAAQPHFGP